ncbi:MAG: GAF domain-containing protein, partial [Mesorhizobium sp.]
MAAKLFTTLVLLGAIAVMVSGALGYFRARDALEKAVFDQLTAARQTKTRQVENYFRTKMTRTLGREPALSDYLPVDGAPYDLQYHYIVENPNPAERRKLLDDAGDGSEYSRLHAIYHPLMRAAATTVGFFDLMIADPKSGRLIYTVEKEVDFTTSLQLGPYRSANVAAAVARCSQIADPSAICLVDFASYAPSGGAPIAFMAAPVIAQGAVIGVLVAKLSNDEIDSVVTGNRRWRQEGFGGTG